MFDNILFKNTNFISKSIKYHFYISYVEKQLSFKI